MLQASYHERGSMPIIALIVLVIIVVVVGYLILQREADEQDTVMTQDESPVMNEQHGSPAMIEEDVEKLAYTHTADLSDVTNGATLRGITTNGQSRGIAEMVFTDQNIFHLRASFTNLPDPEGDDFYEGWVVRNTPRSVVSTGRAQKNGSVYVNSFVSQTDLTDHDTYILTLEPNDGDPAPADHIVEGDFINKADEAAKQAAEQAAIDAIPDPVVVEISGENFSFSRDEIRVRQGDRVVINFTSESGFHDWVVDEFDAATEQVTTGDSSTVEFIADTKGSFEYYCSVGNHRELGMTGTLIVE